LALFGAGVFDLDFVDPDLFAQLAPLQAL